jgi:site-specific DNA-cytosine methylase
MGFAGGFAVGVDQAGFDIISKREPDKFNGFGMPQVLYNMPWVDGQVAAPEDWDGPLEPDIDLVYGCPPCSGFSQLSFINTVTAGAVVGPDAPINECMTWFVDYVARVKPEVSVMESVAVAFKNGKEFMEALWERLREQSGEDYYLTHVVMNNSLIGGDVIRPRYFMVAHRQPFGVGLEFVEPRTMIQVIGDLPKADEWDDPDWAHHTIRGTAVDRWRDTFKWLKKNGRRWREGSRLPDNVEGLEPPPFWLRPDGQILRRNKTGFPVLSHWYSSDPFATYRWTADKPFGVIVGDSLNRAMHPTAPRPITFREAARLVSLPDDWSLRTLVQANSGAELGKAVTSAAGKWIAHWARMSIEGTPGEYAGVAQDYDDRIRVIDVRDQKHVDAILRDPPEKSFWDGGYADPDPATWLIDRRERPATWWQRDDPNNSDVINRAIRDASRTNGRRTRTERAPRRAKTAVAAPVASAGPIRRVPPEKVVSALSAAGMSKQEFATALGVSMSRVNELTTHTRPKSWLNEARWAEVQEVIGGR